MNSECLTVLFLVIFASCHISAFDVMDGKNFDFQMKGKLAKENDNSIEDRETRKERDINRNSYVDDLENSDEDLFFAEDNDEVKKSFDYNDWETAKGFEINHEVKKTDEEKENDEKQENEEEEKEQEEEKGILRRLFEKFKNWVHKVGK